MAACRLSSKTVHATLRHSVLLLTRERPAINIAPDLHCQPGVLCLWTKREQFAHAR